MSYLSVLGWGRTAPPVQSHSSGGSVPTTLPPAARTTADPPAIHPAQPAHMLTTPVDHSEVINANQRKAQAIYDAIDAKVTLNAHTHAALRNGGPFKELDGAFDALKQLIDDPQTAMSLGTQALVDCLRADQALKPEGSGLADASASLAPVTAEPRQLSLVTWIPDGQSRHSSPGSSPPDSPPFQPYSDAENNNQAESYRETAAVDDSSEHALEGREGSASDGIAAMTSQYADSDHDPVARSTEEAGSSSTKIDAHTVLRPRTETASSNVTDSTSSLVKPSKAKPRRGSSRAPSSSGPARKKRKSQGPITKLPFGTLDKSDGIARIAGVKWPPRGRQTFEGITKDIQCEACGGRLHWACAGLKEDESVVGRSFRCADCQHLLDNDQSLDLPVKDGDKCVRPSCVRRSHSKIITSQNDVPRYMVEKPLGRRVSEPATEETGAKYEYLIKWWKYPLEESTWEPETSFPVPSEIADQFLEAAMDEGVSMKRLKSRIVVLHDADSLFPEESN